MKIDPLPGLFWPATEISISGRVQGMGMRPFACSLARSLSLCGWVRNTPAGLLIHIEGEPCLQRAFAEKLLGDPPPHASFTSIGFTPAASTGLRSFEIAPSGDQGGCGTRLLPDIATCANCLEELFDSSDRRYRYPFVTCTSCGPRYSILEGVPYDRERTTMIDFAMCGLCAAEYADPDGRRFHSQTNSCSRCGPRLQLYEPFGKSIAMDSAALDTAVEAIRSGLVVAVKGIGGVHLVVDATNDRAVERLRERKQRARKPFAVMFPSLNDIGAICDISAEEADLLSGPGAPIVLLTAVRESGLAYAVAPESHLVGALLPYSPLHHLLLHEIARPLVLTSANLGSHPMCLGDEASFGSLRVLCDLFLSHNRRIVRALDDSVVRFAGGGPVFIRRARGFSPTYLPAMPGTQKALGVGGQQKNAIALCDGNDLILSEHIGELEGEGALERLAAVVSGLSGLSGVEPKVVCRDLHPDYGSGRFAETYSEARGSLPMTDLQHHIAHLIASLAECPRRDRLTALVWDGTGYGNDGSLWGGETFTMRDGRIERVASLRKIRLAGGEKAVREPWRIAAALLHATFGAGGVTPSFSKAPGRAGLPMLIRALEHGINCPDTSGMGRLFDGVSALCGLVSISDFEGEAAARLEREAWENRHLEETYELSFEQRGVLWEIDYRPLVRGVSSDLALGRPPCIVAMKFHNWLADIALSCAERFGEPLLLGGGCFQNGLLVDLVTRRARSAGIGVVMPRTVPPNDAGICVGQVSCTALRRAPTDCDKEATRCFA